MFWLYQCIKRKFFIKDFFNNVNKSVGSYLYAQIYYINLKWETSFCAVYCCTHRFHWTKLNLSLNQGLIWWKSQTRIAIVNFTHCVKSVLIRSYCGQYFPAFGRDTERYFVSLRRIQSECRKIRTGITWNMDRFYAVANK